MLNDFERQTSVPKVYVFLGLLGLYFFLVFFNIAGEFLVNFAGFIVPGYYSMQALLTTNKTDDTQVRLYTCGVISLRVPPVVLGIVTNLACSGLL